MILPKLSYLTLKQLLLMRGIQYHFMYKEIDDQENLYNLPNSYM